MSVLNDIISRKAKEVIKVQQQPKFPLSYDNTYGPYTPITNIEESYKRNFINLLLTSPGEWPMHPDVGVGLRHYLFEFPNSPKLQSLAPTIREQLKRHLPQIRLVDLAFRHDPEDLDNNRTTIILAYVILESIGVSTSFKINPDLSTAIKVIEESRQQLQGIELLNRAIGIVSDIESL